MASGDLPASRRLADVLRALIAQGSYPVGERLPSLAETCREYGVSEAAVRGAWAALREEGLVRTEQGSGTYVVAVPGRSIDERVGALEDALRALQEKVQRLESES